MGPFFGGMKLDANILYGNFQLYIYIHIRCFKYIRKKQCIDCVGVPQPLKNQTICAMKETLVVKGI